MQETEILLSNVGGGSRRSHSQRRRRDRLTNGFYLLLRNRVERKPSEPAVAIFLKEGIGGAFDIRGAASAQQASTTCKPFQQIVRRLRTAVQTKNVPFHICLLA